MRVMFLEPRSNLEYYLTRLEQLMESLVTDYGADSFYFGEVTPFAYAATSIMNKLRKKYPYCELVYVVSDRPDAPPDEERKPYPKFIYLSALAVFGRRDAAFARNVWMIDHCDLIVLYPPEDQMTDLSFREFAYKKGKMVVMAE